MELHDEKAAAAAISAVDEKIRSIIMALAFLVAGSVPIFFVGRNARGLKPAAITWDGYGWNVSNAFLVLFGAGMFLSITWALAALDPQAHRPYVLDAGNRRWTTVEEAKYKLSRFAECQAFVWFSVAILTLITLTRIPDTDAHTRTWVILGSLIAFVWVPVVPLLGMLEHSMLSGRSATTLLALYVAPAVVATILLALAIAGEPLRWAAVLYALASLVGTRILLLRPPAVAVPIALAWAVGVGGLAGGLGAAF
jgi:hypothetical protein